MYAATLSLEVQGAVAQAVEGALAVEERTHDDLQVHLMSEDLPSLRAAVNSFLRWASMAAEVSQGAEQLMDNTYENTAHQGG